MVKTTSSAVNSTPSVNFTPWRRWKRKVSGSICSQLVASVGWGSPLASRWTSCSLVCTSRLCEAKEPMPGFRLSGNTAAPTVRTLSAAKVGVPRRSRGAASAAMTWRRCMVGSSVAGLDEMTGGAVRAAQIDEFGLFGATDRHHVVAARVIAAARRHGARARDFAHDLYTGSRGARAVRGYGAE